MLESVEVGLICCDADGRLVLNNRAERELFGLPSRLDGAPTETLDAFLDVFATDGTRITPDHYPLIRALRGEDVSREEVLAGPAGGPYKEIVVRARQVLAADGSLLGAVAALTDVSAERAAARALHEAQAALLHSASHDHLTGLPNRALLVERLEQVLAEARRSGQDIAVLFADLDGFKAINDGAGHATGDSVLVTIAERMAGVLREGDLVARVGGDEFVLILDSWRAGPADDEDETPVGVRQLAERVAARLSEAVSRPIAVDHRQFLVEVSIGIACASFAPGSTAEPALAGARAADWLLNRADRAMYQSKAARRSTAVAAVAPSASATQASSRQPAARRP